MKLQPLSTLFLLALAATVGAQGVRESAPSTPRAPRAPRAAAVARSVSESVTEVPPLPPEPPQPAAAPRAAAAPAPPTPPPAPPATRPSGQMVNVRIEVIVADSNGSSKTLTMLIADGESGMNRTVNSGATVYQLNADATPMIVGNRIRLRLTVDVAVPIEADKEKTSSAGAVSRPLSLRQAQTLILADGEKAEVARAADPVSERSFIVSVSARIQK